MISKNRIAVQSFQGTGFMYGLAITALIAFAAKCIAELPFFSVTGPLVLAILLGMGFKALVGVPAHASVGIAFSSKRLLRLGIILLGMRLNLMDIVNAGPQVFAIAAINIGFTIIVVYLLGKWLKIDKKLALLTACGTAICGAAAVVAIAPQLKAKDHETAISAATVAILGTIFTLIYTFIYPVLQLSDTGYGIFAGATLHEVAHVIAAAAPGGQEAIDMAVIVKMSRVAMLVPVAILIGLWHRRSEKRVEGSRFKNVSIPWFIVGFLVMSGIHTAGIIPNTIGEQLLSAAYLLLAMAMAGLGLGVDFIIFKRLGKKPFFAGLIGSVMLSVLGLWLVHVFHLG
ncbi:YeiH family protein [Paenibacillus luteus]|uniref:YeiH family protein n=1 Tax=Paenibacillus luteus TaxID=2545753 RepID=UPI001142F685|nr:YeiH family protein [Paenibacillus luteus]